MIAKLAGLVLVIALVGVAALMVVLLASPFDGLRRDLAERVLEYRLGHEIHVKGDLNVSIGQNLRIAFNDLVVENPDWATKPDMARIQKGKIELRLWPLITGDLVVPHLLVDGAELNFEIATDGQESWRDSGEEAVGDNRLGLPLLGAVSIKNFTLDWLDKSNGFDIDLKLENLNTQRANDDGANSVSGSGALNGTEFTVTGRLPALDKALSSNSSHAVQLALATKSIQISLDGKIEDPLEGEGVDVGLKAKVASLGDLLDVLEIERALEGEGDVAARITGDIGSLSLTGLKTDVKTETGDTAKLTGSIARIGYGTGIDLDFKSKFASTRAAAGSDSFFDGLRLIALSGKLTGDLDALQISAMHVRTNAYAREFKRIGPISVKQFRKDDQNQLQLLGINAIAGPTDSPAFELRGSIGDLLGLTQLSLFGSFDIDTAPVLGFDAEDVRAKLGKLKGLFQLSDADGSAGLEKLDAKVTGTDILSLTMASVFDDFARGDGLKLDISLNIPSYAALARAVGETPVKIGAIKFDGQLSGDDERIDLKGRARIGKTSLTGNLTGTLKGKRPFLQGELSSPELRWLDLRALALAGGSGAKQPAASAKSKTGSGDEPAAEAAATALTLDAVDLDLKVKVGKIAGSGSGLSNITSHAKLTGGVLTLAPLHMNYLGGSVNINGTFDGRKRPSTLKIKGTVDDWQIGRVLKELGAEAPVSGEMYASFDLSTSGDSAAALWRSLNGSFSSAISRGRIESSVIALTGLDISAYLFSDAAKKGYTQVNCFIGRFALKNGVATATTLLLDTPDIQMVGTGSINLRNDTIDIDVQPHPKRHKLIELGTPFSITGSLSDPKYTSRGKGLRAVGETVLLGQNLLGTLVNLIGDGGKDTDNPCLGTRAR